MSHNLIQYLEDNSLTILNEAMADARTHGGPSLHNVSEDDLQVAMYMVLLKIIDALREKAAAPPATAPRDIRAAFLQYVKELMEFIDGQSAYTLGHTAGVVRHTVQMASRLGLTDEQIEELEYVAWIHNIGLVNQAHTLDILPRELTQDEIKQARNHTVVGAEIIRPIEFLAHMVPIIRYHHHRFDGGSAAGELKGERLPLGARIIAIADAYQAMIKPRAYRPAFTRQEALLEIVRGSGTQFDPKLVPLAHELT